MAAKIFSFRLDYEGEDDVEEWKEDGARYLLWLIAPWNVSVSCFFGCMFFTSGIGMEGDNLEWRRWTEDWDSEKAF